MNDPIPTSPPCCVGRSYVAMRPGHPWHGSSVTVTEKDGQKCACILSDTLTDALLSRPGSRRRKVQVETFTEEELW